MEKIHKYRKFSFVAKIMNCGKNLSPSQINHSDKWEDVTCKTCLKTKQQ